MDYSTPDDKGALLYLQNKDPNYYDMATGLVKALNSLYAPLRRRGACENFQLKTIERPSSNPKMKLAGTSMSLRA